jgi:hypothetical protein
LTEKLPKTRMELHASNNSKGDIPVMRTPEEFSPRKRINAYFFIPGLASLLILLASPEKTQAQSCNNNTIYPDGEYCISATGSSGNNPQMPVLSYGGLGSACDTYSYTLELDFSQPGDSYGNGQSYGVYEDTEAGNVPWIVDWSLNEGDVGQYAEGGNGSFEIDFDGVDNYDEFSFFVYGQNPSTGPTGNIATYLKTLNPPWWFGHALTQESTNRQFYIWNSQFDPSETYTGTPVFGKPDGFGLAQVDGSGAAQKSLLTDNVMWTWTTNLVTGVSIANGKLPNALAYLNNQAALMVKTLQSLNIPTANYPSYYPAPENYSSICSFTYPGAGNNAYYNLEWITEYNTGHWTQWQASSLGWPIVAPLACNPITGVCAIYAYTLCTNQTSTI